MAENVLIREGMIDDAAILIRNNKQMAMETESKQLDPTALGNGVNAALRNASLGIYFVAVLEDRVVGQLMITKEWMPSENALAWWIQSVYVEKAFRGRGIFRKLYQHAQTKAKEAGALYLRLYVERVNDVAKATYEKLGMKDVGFLYNYDN